MYSLKDDMPSIPEQYMSLAIKTKPGVFASMLTWYASPRLLLPHTRDIIPLFSIIVKWFCKLFDK